MTTVTIETTSGKKRMVLVELFGMMEMAERIDSELLLERNVRYLVTDYEYSGYDLYEDNLTGYLYATIL